MEKASKTVKEVFVELINGKKVSLAELKPEHFKSIKLKEDSGLPLIRAIVKDDGVVYVERRLFKRTNNVKIVLYDLEIPLVEDAFNRIPFEERLNIYTKGLRISRDADQLAGSDNELKIVVSLLKKSKAGLLTASEKVQLKELYSKLV